MWRLDNYVAEVEGLVYRGFYRSLLQIFLQFGHVETDRLFLEIVEPQYVYELGGESELVALWDYEGLRLEEIIWVVEVQFFGPDSEIEGLSPP